MKLLFLFLFLPAFGFAQVTQYQGEGAIDTAIVAAYDHVFYETAQLEVTVWFRKSADSVLVGRDDFTYFREPTNSETTWRAMSLYGLGLRSIFPK